MVRRRRSARVEPELRPAEAAEQASTLAAQRPRGESELDLTGSGLSNRAVARLVDQGAWSHTAMWAPERPAPRPVQDVLSAPGEMLSGAGADLVSERGFDPERVRVHHDEAAAEAAMMLDAEAFTAGEHVVFGPDAYEPGSASGRRLLEHELGHVAQAGGRATTRPPTMRAIGANEHSTGVGGWTGVGGDAVQRHPAEKVLKFTAKWLTRKTAKHITKHIARHTRRIAGRAIHSVFKNPRQLRYMVTRTVAEAVEVVTRQGADVATHLVEEGTLRVIQQTTRTPGKIRWLVQKTFRDPIGTAGETLLNIVVDQSGRIVTIFPSRTATLGLTVAGIATFTAKTADAAEQVHASVERQNALELAASADNSSWWEWVPIIGDIWGGNLNSGEGATLAARKEQTERDELILKIVDEAIADIEQDKQQSIGPAERADVDEFVRMVLASGLDVTEEMD